MISAIDYLDIDISDLLGKYIDTKKKNNRVLVNRYGDRFGYGQYVGFR